MTAGFEPRDPLNPIQGWARNSLATRMKNGLKTSAPDTPEPIADGRMADGSVFGACHGGESKGLHGIGNGSTDAVAGGGREPGFMRD